MHSRDFDMLFYRKCAVVKKFLQSWAKIYAVLKLKY